MTERQPLDCRAAGISEICYTECPAFNFLGLERKVATALNDLGLAEQLAEPRRQLVIRHAEAEITGAEHLVEGAAQHDGTGPWKPDFTQLPSNAPNRASLVREYTEVCCGVGAIQVRNISGRNAGDFVGAILTRPEPEIQA